MPSAAQDVATIRPRFEWPLVAILVAAAALRFVHLGYSHFQGDEIKALYPAGASIPGFLFEQTKGPVQFLVTLLVRTITGDHAEWATRVPFALASIAVVLVMFRLARDHWGRPVALLAAALAATCGLLVAFGRIVQYQSFVMLFVSLTAYWILASRTARSRAPLYAAFISYALAMLTHWDALMFGPALAFVVLADCRGRGAELQSHLRHVAAAAAIAVILVALFYLPYFLRPGFAEVAAMLQERVASGQGLSTFERTATLLSLYLPPGALPIGAAFLVIGLIAIVWRAASVATTALVIWFSTAFVFYMFLGGDPRSHVYGYILPGLILIAYGLHSVIQWAARRGARLVAPAIGWLLVVMLGAGSWIMLVDHRVEHPWYPKTMFGRALPNLETDVVQGVFGFPYRRGLDEIGRRFKSGQLGGTYMTNERDVMGAYYFHASSSTDPRYYIHVHHPLSLDRALPEAIAREYRLVDSVFVAGRRTIDVYEK